MSGQGQEEPTSQEMMEIILQQRKELADFCSYVTDHLKDQQEVFHLVCLQYGFAAWLKARDFMLLFKLLRIILWLAVLVIFYNF